MPKHMSTTINVAIRQVIEDFCFSGDQLFEDNIVASITDKRFPLPANHYTIYEYQTSRPTTSNDAIHNSLRTHTTISDPEDYQHPVL